MNRIFVHHTIFRICAPLIYGGLMYLLILLINNSLDEIKSLFNNGELYVCIGLSYISFEAMRLAIRILERRERQDTGSTQNRIIIQVFATLIVSTGLVWISISSYFRFVIGFSIGDSELQVFLVLYAITCILYNLLYFSHYFIQKENKSEIEQERLMQEKLEADFTSFKNEINPNLLYESLETLILTLHHNADQAEEQIDYLAGIYRYSLLNRNKELVSAEEELSALENLLRLINYRYDSNINLLAEIPSASEFYLIPGSLLVSIDTIVRNTLVSKHSPLVIRLFMEDDGDYLVLQHVVNEKLQPHEESLSAFSKLKKSYAFFSEKPFVQVKTGRENHIKFPVMKVGKEEIISTPA